MLVYTFLLYPLLLNKKVKNLNKQSLFDNYTINDDLPNVNILLTLHNEAFVIEKKIQSILNTTYPLSKITIYIGIDACTDATLEIIQAKYKLPNIIIYEFKERQGKPNLLNQLVAQINNNDAILILTDADVLLTETTIFELVKYFKDKQIGLVDSNIKPQRISNINENVYWNYETNIKINESLWYGNIPGPSGGCYAIRKKLYKPIPPKFIVDDFFIGFNIALNNHKTILNKDALCYEDKITTWMQEIHRKSRISAGNFQNLWYFKKEILSSSTPVRKVFLQHKFLRWIAPFLIIIIYYILLLKFTLFILIVTLFLPIIDALLFTFGFEIKQLRQFHYFILMNIAVFIGFIKFCKGIETNVWQPTKRN